MNEHPNDRGDEWHTMNPRIEEAVEIPYDPSKKGPGTLTIEVKFERPEIERLKRGLDRKTMITRFIKEAALAEADRRAADIEAQELLEAD